MQPSRPILPIFAAALALAGPAAAADPKAILGAWVEQLPSGGGIVTVFTDSTISSYGVNAAGERISAPMTMTVSYRDLGKTVGVDFKDGGGLLVAIQSPSAITLNFPDAGSHNLTPWRPVQTPPAKKAR